MATAQELKTSIDLFVDFTAPRAYQIVNGGDTETVTTDAGVIPTFGKAIKDFQNSSGTALTNFVNTSGAAIVTFSNNGANAISTFNANGTVAINTFNTSAATSLANFATHIQASYSFQSAPVVTTLSGGNFIALNDGVNKKISWTNFLGQIQAQIQGWVNGLNSIAGPKAFAGLISGTSQTLANDNNFLTKRTGSESRLPWLNPTFIREVNDYFASGSVVSGGFGSLGWATTMGAGASFGYSRGFNTIARNAYLSTGATANTTAMMYRGDADSQSHQRVAVTWKIDAGYLANGDTALIESRVDLGFTDQNLGGFQYLFVGWDTSISPNWLVRGSGNGEANETVIDSGVPLSEQRFLVTMLGAHFPNSGGVDKIIIHRLNYFGENVDSVFEIPITTFTPSVFNVRNMARIKNLTATARTLKIQSFELRG